MAASAKQTIGGVEEEVAVEEKPRVLAPGAAPFGNFPHYSRFHSPEQRLCLLPPELLGQLFPQGPERKPIVGLDVGCNSGVSDRGRIGVRGAQRLAASMSSGVLSWACHHAFPKNELKCVALIDSVLLLVALQGPTTICQESCGGMFLGYVLNFPVSASAFATWRPNPGWEDFPCRASGACLLPEARGPEKPVAG